MSPELLSQVPSLSRQELSAGSEMTTLLFSGELKFWSSVGMGCPQEAPWVLKAFERNLKQSGESAENEPRPD